MTAQPIEDDDPFADAMLPRDRYKRPLITPPDGGKAVPYTRASTFANELDNGGGLTTWKVRTSALGIARNEDIAAEIAALRYVEPDDLAADAGFEVKAAHKQKLKDLRDDKSKLDELCETAIHRIDGRASHGTAVHAFTDPDPSPFVPSRMDADVKSYFAALEEFGIEQVLSEKFVVCDELQVAGTFDGTYNIPAALLRAAGYAAREDDIYCVVGDKKTGSIHEVAVAIQTAVYSRGQLYTPELDGSATREALGVRQDVALLIHIPKGKGRTYLYLIDLRLGWVAANLAVAVRDMNGRKDIVKALPKPGSAPVADVAEAAPEAPVSTEKPRRRRRTKAEMAAARAAEAEAASAPTAVEEAREAGLLGPAPTESGVLAEVLVPEPVERASERIIGDIKAEREAPVEMVKGSSTPNNPTGTPLVPVEPSNADRIATAPSVEALLELHSQYGHTWTDDDKALATARRNLLLGGVATTAVQA